MNKAAVIIPAAGSGTRMKLNYPKQFHKLAGAPILIHTIKAFFSTQIIDQIIVVVPQDSVDDTRVMIESFDLHDKRVLVIAGGVRRQDSVHNGLNRVNDNIEIVLVHDGARPLVKTDLIEKCFEEAKKSGAAIAAIPVKDTLKKGDAQDRVEATINREGLWQAQTPQAAQVPLLKEAYLKNNDKDVTDESSLLESAGIQVTLVEGSETNIKITRPEDLQIAERILTQNMAPTIRIGHGFDAHKFAENRPLVLGGITIPHSHGLAGHSDADVLTHAVCDALLGAIGAGDIGKHFPDTSKQYKDIYSIKLLSQVMEHVDSIGFTISNVDITVICQRPKLAPFIDEMRQILATTCGISISQVNLKATTTEKMGYTGREEGISCHAVALIQHL